MSDTFSLTPLLINRAALSLKRTADISSKGSLAWNTGHFSSARFKPIFPTMVPSVVNGPSDGSTATRMDDTDHNDIPLDELAHDKPRSPTRHSFVVSQSMV